MALSSMTWGYARIIAGTLLGGTLGFYVMHRVEVSYKMKMEEALKQYEKDMKKRQEEENLGQFGEESV
ncbi:ATP-dependent helicase/nuclease subunit [Hirschfeldia incana]|nr:ATP-dependent helicase/nuclease subunit [Hirschfeldia incana]